MASTCAFVVAASISLIAFVSILPILSFATSFSSCNDAFDFLICCLRVVTAWIISCFAWGLTVGVITSCSNTAIPLSFSVVTPCDVVCLLISAIALFLSLLILVTSAATSSCVTFLLCCAAVTFSWALASNSAIAAWLSINAACNLVTKPSISVWDARFAVSTWFASSFKIVSACCLSLLYSAIDAVV